MKSRIALLLSIAVLGAEVSCAENPIEEVAEMETIAANNSFINEEAPMFGTVNLWQKVNIPTVTRNVNNSDGPDFIPNLEVFTVSANVTPKGAVMICPGGAFMFRSMQNEGYDIADMLTSIGYQCFVVNYRISPYNMQESATDLQRGIRYVKAHAEEYRINPENIALVGFSPGVFSTVRYC